MKERGCGCVRFGREDGRGQRSVMLHAKGGCYAARRKNSLIINFINHWKKNTYTFAPCSKMKE